MNLTDNIPNLTAIVNQGASCYGIELNKYQLSCFQKYYELVLHESNRQNLVSRNDLKRFAHYHILDSLKVASCHDFTLDRRLLDFGSGAGLPGIPLAIVFPFLDTVLVDSRAKKCGFLDTVCSSLPVPNARVVCSRIENIDVPPESLYDVVITRATVTLAKFYKAASRFVAPGGSMIAIKGENIDAELKDLESTVDSSLFNITCTYPTPVANVRSGTIIIINKATFSTNASKNG